MDAGRLIHRLSIRRQVESSDGHDGLTETPTTIRDRVAAQIVPLQGRDLERARQVDPRASHTVTLRYWQAYLTDLRGGRVVLIWHDGTTDRELEAVEPPRELTHRDELAMTVKEAA